MQFRKTLRKTEEVLPISALLSVRPSYVYGPVDIVSRWFLFFVRSRVNKDIRVGIKSNLLGGIY